MPSGSFPAGQTEFVSIEVGKYCPRKAMVIRGKGDIRYDQPLSWAARGFDGGESHGMAGDQYKRYPINDNLFQKKPLMAQ